MLGALLLAACSSTVSLQTTDATELSFEAGLIGPARSFLVDVLGALRAEGQGMFDLARAEEVAAERGVILQDLREPEPGSLLFSARLADMQELATVISSDSLTVRRDTSAETVRLVLGRSLADDLLALLPEAERGAMELFLPEDGSSREEYLDYLQWLLEGYGETEELIAIVEQTQLRLVLHASPGWRVSRADGEAEALEQSNGGIRVDVPVFPLLLGEWSLAVELQRP